MAEVTGIQLREGVRLWTLQHSAVSSAFDESLVAFPDDKKPSPSAVAEQIRQAEDALAHLQTAQAFFNLNVEVEYAGRKTTLLEAIKLVGGAGRVEKLWRKAASQERDRYASRSETREPNLIVAKRTVSYEDALQAAKKSAIFAGALRAAIAEGNSRRVNIPFLKVDLLKA